MVPRILKISNKLPNKTLVDYLSVSFALDIESYEALIYVVLRMFLQDHILSALS